MQDIEFRCNMFVQIAPEESWLSFDQEAIVLHNKVILCSFIFHFSRS